MEKKGGSEKRCFIRLWEASSPFPLRTLSRGKKRKYKKNSPFPPVARDIRVYCSESVRTASASASERLEEML